MSWSGYRKQKDGPQQGTLFDLREVPSEPVDSPGMRKRGRRAEMVDAMPLAVRVVADGGVRPEVEQKVLDRRGPGLPPVGMSGGEQAGRHHRAALGRQFADETTVPPEDLRGISEIGLGRNLGPGTAGMYSGRTREISFANVNPSAAIATHEVGHHVSTKEPGYTERQSSQAVGPTRAVQHPSEEAFADDYAVRHGQPAGYEPHVREAPDKDFSREYIAARETWPKSNTPGLLQQDLFATEPAFTPEANVEVQAYTRDEGREVIGWSPNRYTDDPESTHKHEYDPTDDAKPFWGANYVTMFDDDVIPERRYDDIHPKEARPKQTWKQR